MPLVGCGLLKDMVCTNNRCWATDCAEESECNALGKKYCSYGRCYGDALWVSWAARKAAEEAAAADSKDAAGL